MLMVLMMAPALMFSQGSGSVGGGGVVGSASPRGNGSFAGFEVTKTIKLRVVAVQKDGTLLVKDERGNPLIAKLDKKVVVRAEKGTEFAGQKHIKIDNLEPGMFVKATYRTSDAVVVELRILREPKKAPPSVRVDTAQGGRR